MKNKVISSLREVDWKEIPVPMVVIYKKTNGLSGGMYSKGI